MNNQKHYETYVEKHLSMLDTMSNPVVFSVNMQMYIDLGVSSASDIISYGMPIQFNGMMPSLLVCSDADFIIVKIKYGKYIVSTWSRGQFLSAVADIYDSSGLTDDIAKEFKPLMTLRWLLNRFDNTIE
jgi:hypothetical protein